MGVCQNAGEEHHVVVRILDGLDEEPRRVLQYGIDACF